MEWSFMGKYLTFSHLFSRVLVIRAEMKEQIAKEDNLVLK
jgi:hypothetical protein